MANNRSSNPLIAPASLDDREKVQAELDRRKRNRWRQVCFQLMQRGGATRKRRLREAYTEQQRTAKEAADLELARLQGQIAPTHQPAA